MPSFARQIAGDSDAATLKALRTVGMHDQPRGACHGGETADDVRVAIAARYPQDHATGFSAGDLRGAILVSGSQHDSAQFGETR